MPTTKTSSKTARSKPRATWPSLRAIQETSGIERRDRICTNGDPLSTILDLSSDLLTNLYSKGDDSDDIAIIVEEIYARARRLNRVCHRTKDGLNGTVKKRLHKLDRLEAGRIRSKKPTPDPKKVAALLSPRQRKALEMWQTPDIVFDIETVDVLPLTRSSLLCVLKINGQMHWKLTWLGRSVWRVLFDKFGKKVSAPEPA